MKLFIDTADLDEIKELASWGVIDGVTTNPTLVARSGKSFKEIVNEIFNLVNGPISLEAVSTRAEDIIKEARQLAKTHKNAVVKIPMTPGGLKAIKKLSTEGIKTNVTLVFSANQALLAAKAGATYVSPFIGRLDDIGQEGMQIVEEIMEIFYNYDIPTEVIVASVRHPIHVIQAAQLGADIATVPPKVLRKMVTHSLTDKGIKSFLDDWKKVKK